MFGVVIYAPRVVAQPVARQHVMLAFVSDATLKKAVLGDDTYAPAFARQALAAVEPFGRQQVVPVADEDTVMKYDVFRFATYAPAPVLHPAPR